MARRGGKAANRKAKQRKTQRAASAASGPVARPSVPGPALPIEPSASAPTVAAVAPTAPVVREPARRPSRDPRAMIAGSSRLGERALEEYHYVKRDLRNIGVLLVIMIVLLIAAFVVFNVLGLTKTP